MASQAPQSGGLDIGQVISRGFQAVRSQFVSFVILGLLLVGLPSLLVLMYMPTNTSDPEAVLATFTSPTYWLTFTIDLLLSFLFTAAAVKITIAELRGERAQLGQVLFESLKLILPLIGLTIVLMFAVGFGLILLFVPGVILFTMWLVAVPVLVEERVGVFGSLSRSAELTKGSRWWIFLLIVIYFVAGSMLGAVATPINLASGGQQTLPVLIVSTLVSLVLSVISVAVLAALYIELRLIKDGSSQSGLEEIFA